MLFRSTGIIVGNAPNCGCPIPEPNGLPGIMLPGPAVGLAFPPPPGAKACTAPAMELTALAIASTVPPLAGCWAWGTWAGGIGDCGAEASDSGLVGWVAGDEVVSGERGAGMPGGHS